MLTQEQKEAVKRILHDASDVKLRNYLEDTPSGGTARGNPFCQGFVPHPSILPELLPSGVEMTPAIRQELIQMVKDEIVWRFRFLPEPYRHVASIWMPDEHETVILFNQDKISPDDAQEVVSAGRESPYVLVMNREQMRCLFDNEFALEVYPATAVGQ